MKLRRLERLVLGANGVFWLIFAVWLVQSIKPLPSNASELQDSVNYPVSQTSHLPYEAARSSVMWRIYSTMQFPAGVVSRMIVPSFRSDSTLFGVTLLVWRLVLTMLLSFGQWFLMAKALGWLLDLLQNLARRPPSAGVAATLLLAGIACATGHATMRASSNQVNERCV